MLKKMLVLLAILALANLASAAISLQTSASGTDFSDPGAAIDLMPSDTIWIGIYQDIQLNANTMIFITAPAPGSWTGQSVVFTPPALSGVPGWTYYGVIEGMDAWNGDFGLPGTEQGGPGLFGAVQFHCDAPGDVFITLTDENLNQMDTLVIHQIPEPATMVLLGLGGLFFRKKK
ncbi:MAG: PEP-CTERM sorting domain-containing protein [Phycisphaerae bacterium]|jgi:hypothetical protein